MIARHFPNQYFLFSYLQRIEKHCNVSVNRPYTKNELLKILAAERMKTKYFFALLSLLFVYNGFVFAQGQAQLSAADKSALEGIIVEKYYVAGPSDYADTSGGALPEGAITYRIYVDMKPDYRLQVVYGKANHELRIVTSTTFYNNKNCGALVGYNVEYSKLNEGAYALDSWITLNSATNRHAGVLRADDSDGSILTKKDFTKTDGLTNGNLPVFKPFNIDLNFFNWVKDPSVFTTSNGGWGALSGVVGGTKGPTADNRVLIAQLTTNGKLSFDLNIQVGTPSGGTVQFVAKNAEGSEIKFAGLSYGN